MRLCPKPELPEGQNDRAADIWEPLLALADLAGGEWPKRAQEASGGIDEGGAGGQPDGVAAAGYSSQPGHERERIFSRGLVARLNTLSDRPWMEPRRGRQI